MKKVIAVLLMATMCIAFVSCGSSTKKETHNGLSYEYSSDAVRSESDNGIEYNYGGVEDDADFIITIKYENYDPLIYENAVDMLADWMSTISENDECFNLKDGTVVIDGNKALFYTYGYVSDAPANCKTIFLLHGDKVLNISAFGITNDDCVKELTNIVDSMKLD